MVKLSQQKKWKDLEPSVSENKRKMRVLREDHAEQAEQDR